MLESPFGSYQLQGEEPKPFEQAITPSELEKFVAEHRELLQAIRLPNITEVPETCFRRCSALKSVDMPMVETIGDEAFSQCVALTTVSFLRVETIGVGAFFNCAALISVDMPKVIRIAGGAFSQCVALTSVDMPLVTMIGDDAFLGCSELRSVVMSQDMLDKHHATLSRESNSSANFTMPDGTQYAPKSQVAEILGTESRVKPSQALACAPAPMVPVDGGTDDETVGHPKDSEKGTCLVG